MALEIVEWPGGASKRLELAVSPEVLINVRRGRKFVQIPNPRPLANWAEIPWGSLARLCSNEDDLLILTGPAKFKQGEWSLPVLDWNETHEKAKAKVKSMNWRSKHGMEPDQV